MSASTLPKDRPAADRARVERRHRDVDGAAHVRDDPILTDPDLRVRRLDAERPRLRRRRSRFRGVNAPVTKPPARSARASSSHKRVDVERLDVLELHGPKLVVCIVRRRGRRPRERHRFSRPVDGRGMRARCSLVTSAGSMRVRSSKPTPSPRTRVTWNRFRASSRAEDDGEVDGVDRQQQELDAPAPCCGWTGPSRGRAQSTIDQADAYLLDAEAVGPRVEQPPEKLGVARRAFAHAK